MAILPSVMKVVKTHAKIFSKRLVFPSWHVFFEQKTFCVLEKQWSRIFHVRRLPAYGKQLQELKLGHQIRFHVRTNKSFLQLLADYSLPYARFHKIEIFFSSLLFWYLFCQGFWGISEARRKFCRKFQWSQQVLLWGNFEMCAEFLRSTCKSDCLDHTFY